MTDNLPADALPGHFVLDALARLFRAGLHGFTRDGLHAVAPVSSAHGRGRIQRNRKCWSPIEYALFPDL